MAKSKTCSLILNTKNGYCLSEMKFHSIKEATEYAKDVEMAGRIFINGKLHKRI